jgi:hypothetical protein
MRSCQKPYERIVKGDPELIIQSDTVTQVKYVDRFIPFKRTFDNPTPSTSDTLAKDTVMPLVENTYRFPSKDSTVKGEAVIIALGTVKHFSEDFTANVKAKETIVTVTNTVEKPMRNMVYLGAEAGFSFNQANVGSMAYSVTFAQKKGYGFSVKYDVYNKIPSVGFQYRLYPR